MEKIKEKLNIENKNVDLKVIDVEILQNLCLLLEFSNGERKIFDVNQLLNYPVYEKLKDEDIFNSVSIKNGIIVWDNENIDVGTDYLYKNSENYNN